MVVINSNNIKQVNETLKKGRIFCEGKFVIYVKGKDNFLFLPCKCVFNNNLSYNPVSVTDTNKVYSLDKFVCGDLLISAGNNRLPDKSLFSS